ncbi:hypothetical protein ACEPAG_7164 [Sanghuangporus baumii]
MARSEPINATHAHSKAKVSLFFADALFVAGEHVSGKMELECKAERGLGIGDIKVELFAIQELTSRDHSATNTFLHLTRYFQGTGLPPSNAVHPHPLPGDDNVLPVDYHLARKGTTTFFFKFPLPASSPASIDFGKGLAKLKYEVRATVSVSWRNERQRVMERREVIVVEAPDDHPEDTERIVVGENGKIWAQGRVLNPYVVAGRDACVELFVKNHSTKRTTGLSLTLARYLHLPSTSHLQQTLQLSDVLANIPFRGPEYIVQPGTEGVANLVFSVPRNAQGVRSGRLETGEEDEGREPVESLFDVQCMLEIKIGMGLGNKDILLELPITIFHPAAMRALPLISLPDPPMQRLYSPPAQTMSPYQSPPFSPAYDAYPGAYISPPMSPPVLPPNLPLWSPPPAHVIPPQQPMMLDQWYYYPPPPPVQYAYPARPSSADPFVSRPLPTLPTQNVSVPAGTGAPAQNGVVLAGVGVDMNARPVEGEPGKGERASRISAHLRMSSRNRSASPPSHRFPEAAVLPPSMIDNGVTPAQLQVVPSPLLVDFPRTSPTQSHEVLSPRPALTPKQSFSHDRGTVKSDHVIDLERMAVEQEAEKNSSPNMGRRSENRNKTLPPAPDYPETPDTPRLPPEPTLLPLPTRPRPEIWGRESGLAALERKLLEQVGTRKLEASRPPDVRSVLPEPIKIPSANDPRSDPPNDSAISSLALGADNSFQDAPPPPKLDAVLSTSPLARQDGVDEDTSLERRMVNGRKKGKHNHARNLREAATGRVAAWLGRIDCAASPPEAQTPPFSSPEVSLQDLPSPTGLDPHPLLRSPAVVLPEKEETNESPKHDTIPTRSSGFVLHAAKDTSSTFAPPPSKRSEIRASPQNGAATSSPETPTVTSPSSLKPVLRRLMEAPGKGQPSDAKYDIRSARGGRGGKVTSVAALWASLASQQQQQSNPSPLVRQPEKAAGTFTPTFKGAQTRTTPEKDKERDKRRPPRTPPQAKKRHEDTNGMNVADLSARRARMVKATSVPAIVSSSLATPVLSSTASLARPIQAASYPTKQRTYPPVHTSLSPFSELSPLAESSPPRAHASSSSSSSPLTTTPRSPAVANELAFGQARLKDLIRKYQQGFGQ